MDDKSIERARAFAALHVKGNPLVLFNIWDAGSAQAVAEAGAKAIATGSWSVAAAAGFGDGEALPLTDALANIQRIVQAVDLPVTLDFEGGYAAEPGEVADNVAKARAVGAIGINFEDQVVGGNGLYTRDEQAKRIAAIRRKVGDDFFINARTDLFLQAAPEAHDEALLDEAIERGHAYAGEGASGFFAPGLRDERLIEKLCTAVKLPVNIMAFPGVPDADRLGTLGVARISHGPGPYRLMMQKLTEAARAVLQ